MRERQIGLMNIFRSIPVRMRRANQGARKAMALFACDYATLVNGRVSADVAGQIRAAQIHGIRRYRNAMAAANLFNAAVLVISLWPTPLRGASIRRAIRNAAFLGAIWGVVPLFMFGGAPEDSRLVIVCLCAGMLGGGAAALASVPAAAVAMLTPIAIGSIIGLAKIDGGHAILPISLLLTYCAILVNAVFDHAFTVTARLISRIEIQRLARRDSMTDLPNAAALRDAINVASVRLNSAGEACMLFCIDIDRLRDVNERLGHAAGDELLHQVASRLRTAIRDVDIAARLDGDRFSILAMGLGGDATSRAYANRLLATFSAPFELPGGEAKVTACIGVAIAAPGAARADDLLRNANLALFVAKERGSGQVHVHTMLDDAGRHARDALAADLREALANGQLRLNLQPFLDIANNKVVGFEALLRWTHPVRGAVSPIEIISIAEEHGMLEAIGLWVLNEACGIAASWPAHLRVAVNVSPLQLRSPAIVSQVVAALGKSGLSGRRLEIEVTENALIDDPTLARHVLTTLRHAGVRLALDDFGVGFSSLNYLRQLPFDRIKIDRSFMAETQRDPDARAIVRAILSLAKDLRLEVTAEGIETPEQLEFLRDNDCPEAQGYLIAKPMSEDVVADFLAGWGGRAAA